MSRLVAAILVGIAIFLIAACGTASEPEPDPFVGTWTGTTELGGGGLSIEIRKQGDDDYEIVGRIPLHLRSGALVGEDSIEFDDGRTLKVDRRFEQTGEGVLLETMTAHVGGDMGDVDSRVTWRRESE